MERIKRLVEKGRYSAIILFIISQCALSSTIITGKPITSADGILKFSDKTFGNRLCKWEIGLSPEPGEFYLIVKINDGTGYPAFIYLSPGSPRAGTFKYNQCIYKKKDVATLPVIVWGTSDAATTIKIKVTGKSNTTIEGSVMVPVGVECSIGVDNLDLGNLTPGESKRVALPVVAISSVGNVTFTSSDLKKGGGRKDDAGREEFGHYSRAA